MRKALKNIPKPDEDKLAFFYGQAPGKKPEESSNETKMATVDKMTIIDKVATGDSMTTVIDYDLLRDKLKTFFNYSQQFIYINLFKRTHAIGQDQTGWVGYSELAKGNSISIRTVQRSIEAIIKRGLIKKIDFINTGETKGTKYQVFLPDDIKMSTGDKMTTADKLTTIDNN